MKELLENHKNELKNLILNKCNNVEGPTSTDIPFLHFFTTNTESKFIHVVYEPSICIAIQGSKVVCFGNNVKEYNEGIYLLSSTNVPANIKIQEASKDKPYISICILFTLEQIYEVMKELNNNKLKNKSKPDAGLFFGDMSYELLNPVLRLVKLLDCEKSNRDFISNLIIKEILCVLLNQESGKFLKQYVMEGSISNQIVKIIREIKDNFFNSLNIKEIAEKFNMSESTLYHNFKKVTMLSPIQFQKKLRLEEAKNILSTQNIEVAEVAFIVGYESASQFSREYSRMFGLSPKAHSSRLKN